MRVPARLDFYFDFLSPYAYFSWRRLRPLCDKFDAELYVHPVVFGKLLDHWGQRGPAEVPPKKALLYRYCYRYASSHGFAFNPPRCHPFHPLPSLRLALAEVSGEQQFTVIDALFEAGWSHGADLGCADSLKEILQRAGLDGAALLAATQNDSAKNALRRETERAIAQGVFGVPSFVLDGELFWGNDQLEHVELCLSGGNTIDYAAIDEMLARPRGIDRKAVTG